MHLDDFEVSHTKDDILWLGDQEEEVERGPKQHSADYREAAKEYRKHKEDQRGPTEIETNTPGRYGAKIKIDMSGDWNAKISYEGPHGQGQQSFPITAK